MDNLTHTHMDVSHSQDHQGGDDLRLDRRLDRRGVLRFGGTAALAGAAVAALHAPGAGAAAASAPGVMRFGATNAAGVVATGLTSSNTTFSLSVTNSGLGSALHAATEAPDNSAPTLVVSQSGTGNAIAASVSNAKSNASAAKVATNGTGAGLEASSAAGVGAKLAGKTASLQLMPSTAPTHPASGAPGSFFVDQANRLWFCSGGPSWHRLA